MFTVLFYRQDVYSIVYGTGPNVYNFDYYTGTMCTVLHRQDVYNIDFCTGRMYTVLHTVQAEYVL
jgi:hypothetical protein